MDVTLSTVSPVSPDSKSPPGERLQWTDEAHLFVYDFSASFILCTFLWDSFAFFDGFRPSFSFFFLNSYQISSQADHTLDRVIKGWGGAGWGGV